VIEKCQTWGNPDQLMFVVGATRPEMLAKIRSLAPEYTFLVPGVGAQGGKLEEVMDAGWTNFGGLLINASRSILYAGSGPDFAEAASAEARSMQLKMGTYFNRVQRS